MPAIRPATLEDAAAVAAIYAPVVETGTASFELYPPTPADMAARIGRVLDAGWPWLVAEEAGVVVGYAYAAQFRDRPAYAHSCESSVYVASGHHGKGVGRALMLALFEAARAAGFREMVAVVGDSGNAASIALHERMGFRRVGKLIGVGEKFGRLLDVVYLQRPLG